MPEPIITTGELKKVSLEVFPPGDYEWRFCIECEESCNEGGVKVISTETVAGLHKQTVRYYCKKCGDALSALKVFSSNGNGT